MNRENKKKYMLISIIIIVVILLVIGITYAYWILTKQQTGENVVNSSCLNITFTGENDINLEKAYPLSEEKLDKFLSTATPYHFTIKNECDSLASVTINIESLNAEAEKQLKDEYINVILYQTNYKANLNNEKKLTEKINNDENKVLKESQHAYGLYNFTLDKNEEKEFNLQIYLDQDTPMEAANMNATWKGKVTISAGYKEEQYATIGGKKIALTYSKDGLYEVIHNVSEISEEWNKTEYRYAGVNPDNYVIFNNEIWRIIGLVNVKTESGVEQRIKIVRTDGIEGQKDFGNYAWDRDIDYTNNWTTSKLKDMLNGIYYESKTGECYIGDGVSQCDFNSGEDLPKGLNANAQNMIDKELIWNIGGWEDLPLTLYKFYEKERGTNTGNSNAYPAEWSNETDVGDKHNGVGLIYPSDYGYATNGGNLGRKICFAKELYYWDSEHDSYYSNGCSENNWLKQNSIGWTLTPDITNSNGAFYITSFGGVDNNFGGVKRIYSVWPTLYLTKTVKIISGTGSLEEPYNLG